MALNPVACAVRPMAIVLLADAVDETPIAMPLLAVTVACEPTAMPNEPEDDTDDCPPMAMLSAARALAPPVALAPIAIAPGLTAVAPVPVTVPPPICTVWATAGMAPMPIDSNSAVTIAPPHRRPMPRLFMPSTRQARRRTARTRPRAGFSRASSSCLANCPCAAVELRSARIICSLRLCEGGRSAAMGGMGAGTGKGIDGERVHQVCQVPRRRCRRITLVKNAI